MSHLAEAAVIIVFILACLYDCSAKRLTYNACIQGHAVSDCEKLKP